MRPGGGPIDNLKLLIAKTKHHFAKRWQDGQYPALPDEGWGVPERKEKIIDNTILKSLYKYLLGDLLTVN